MSNRINASEITSVLINEIEKFGQQTDVRATPASSACPKSWPVNSWTSLRPT
jgi:hypothetical protein